MSELHPVQIREARWEDLPGILELYRYLNRMDPVLDAGNPAVAALWSRLMEDRNTHYVVGEQEGRLISTCVLTVILNLTRSTRSYGLIENVVTHPDCRKQGVGTRVLKYAQQLAWDANCYKVQLMTSRKEPEVLRFYETAGFTANEKTGFVVRA